MGHNHKHTMIRRYIENRLTYQTFKSWLRLTLTPWLPRPRQPRRQLRSVQALHMQYTDSRIPQPTQGPLYRI